MVKSNLDKSLEKVSAEFDKVADDVKDTAEDLGSRRSRSSTEKKISIILGIILLVFALIELWDMLWGIVLLILGLLCVFGFFNRPIRDVIHYFKNECPVCKRAKQEDHNKKHTSKSSK